VKRLDEGKQRVKRFKARQKKGFFRLFGVAFMSFLLLACGDQGKKEKTWVVGVSADNPPFVFVDTQKRGQITGFEVELAKAIAQEAGQQIEFRDMDFGGLIASLQSKRIDLSISAIEVTPEREKNLDFSESYHQAITVLVSLRAAPLQGEISWEGLKIGTQLGSAHEAYIKTVEATYPHLKRISYNRVNEMVQDLSNGRLTGFLVEKPVAESLMGQYPFVQVTLPSVGKRYGIAFPKGSSLVPVVNQALQKLKEKGVLKILMKKWGI
jgi:arginine/lysine/histidine transporter system substrate-binding protein